MPDIKINVDVSGWTKDEVWGVLDSLFAAKRDVVLGWAKDLAQEWICGDCEERVRA